MAAERLQKILARSGIASRRACEEVISAGRVRVNGRVVSELGTRADAQADKIEVDGRRIMMEAMVYLVMNKPRGVMTTLSDPEGRPTVREYLTRAQGRVFPVGRLDFHTSGALLFTNDGEFADGLMHPKRKVPKTYVVKVRGEMKDTDLERWATGVNLDDGPTQPAEVERIRPEPGKTWIEVTIYEGRNQQIRRMGDATGFPVLRLSRQSVARITVEGLRPGTWRYLTREELRDLQLNYAVPKRLPKTLILEEPASADRPVRATDRRRGGFEKNTRPKAPAGGRRGRTGSAPAEGHSNASRGEARPVEPRGGRERDDRPARRGTPTPSGETRGATEAKVDRRPPPRGPRGPQKGPRAQKRKP